MSDTNKTIFQWFMELPEKLWGFVDKIKEWSKEQKIFFYSMIATFFIISYLIVLPRYDCSTLNNKIACSYIEKQYEKKIEELN